MNKNYSQVINNLLNLLHISSEKKLIIFLQTKGINRNSLGTWKARGDISAKGIMKISEKLGIPIEQIQIELKESEKPPIIKEGSEFPFGVDPEKDFKLFQIVQMLKGDEETQCAIYDFLESKKHFDRASSVMRQFMMRKAGIWFAGAPSPGGDDHEERK